MPGDPNLNHDMSYRRSTAQDMTAVFAITKDAVQRLAPTPYAPEVVATWMANRSPEYYLRACTSGEIWIAEIAGMPVGYSQGVPGEILRLFVNGIGSGRGIGRDLMNKALAQALEQPDEGSGPAPDKTPARIRTTQLVRVDASLSAVAFYQKWGFCEVGRGIVPGREIWPVIDIVQMQANFPVSVDLASKPPI